MIRTALTVVCLSIGVAGCTAGPEPVASSGSAQAATPTPLRQSSVPGGEQFHATELRPGDCVEPLPETFVTTVIPCDVPHSAEYATTYVLPDGPYPDADMRRLTENGCLPRMRVKKPEQVGLWALAPLREGWPRHRTVYCFAVPLDGQRTTGRMVK
ncbi:hypothetical protein OUY22_00880 [Nonomuraea sp. MCN248]|uniref:Septum formation-related domain-containing protein n=1 Tax=Nonomuraea corallina TaxID=2989783 RepID=A0ABT4S448_9ACTN|nr:hypothetical protein [Nonomuraea corallina]MDA0631954.1 hypothetical protein [Nonomuraea corallina]